MRIGLFGGTFNPIHNGHLNCVRETAQAFQLDRIHLIPAAIPPHKNGGNIAAARHRLAMARLAIKGLDNWLVTDLEVARSGPSYTVDTIRHYLDGADGPTEHYFIMGLDSLLEIQAWKSFRQIVGRIPIIVMFRPDTLEAGRAEPFAAMHRHIVTHIDSGYVRSSLEKAFHHPRLQPIYYLAVRPQALSATAIRRRIRSGLPISGLVPDAVDDYIRTQGLYR